MTLPFSFDRAVVAVQAVRERLLKATSALQSVGVPYALTDDNAVAAWVAQVDESAVRNTPDVTIVIRGADFTVASAAMFSAGFVQGNSKQLFHDDPATPRGVQFFFAGEKIIPSSQAVHPRVPEAEIVGDLRVLSVFSLTRTKLATFRDRDRLNLRDLIDVGLIDQTWPARFPAELGERLQLLLDTPGG